MKTAFTLLFALLSLYASAGPNSFTTTPAAPKPDSTGVLNGVPYNFTKRHTMGYAPIKIADQAGLDVDRYVTGITFSRATDHHLIIGITIDYFRRDTLEHFLTWALTQETEGQKQQILREVFKPKYIELSTRDSWIDPVTFSTRTASGERVTPQNTTGAIPELSYLQSITPAQLGMTGLPIEMMEIYFLPGYIQQLDSRGQL